MKQLVDAAIVLTVVLPGVASPQSDAEPELDFLEYLGIWQGQDEEWFVEAEVEGLKDDRSEHKRKETDDED
jgi:hypothetical protein